MLIEATTQTTLGPVYMLTGDDDLNVAAGVTIQSTWNDPATMTGADAVISWTGTHAITVSGTIIGEDEAINLVGCVTAQTVIVQASGVLISGGDGMVLDADGVILDGVGSVMQNFGTINSYGSAASVIVPDAGVTTILNGGSMTGRVSGVWHKFGNGILNFTNTGTVTSPTVAFLGGASTDNVTNSGTMDGGISLGAGNDSYTGLTGTVLGLIHGGAGDDVFRPGSHAETIDGAEGIDLLDFSVAPAAVIVHLENPALNGGLLGTGDSYAGIENVIGSGGADRIFGSAADNSIEGAGKIDTLVGGAGNDTLSGGRGRDRISGGDGADDFVFLAGKHFGDRIHDFVSGTDQIGVEGLVVGLGSYAGALDAALFVEGTAALDGDDRFIWNTTYTTLWFDPDGTGARAAVLLADLQTGSSLAAADIFIF